MTKNKGSDLIIFYPENISPEVNCKMVARFQTQEHGTERNTGRLESYFQQVGESLNGRMQAILTRTSRRIQSRVREIANFTNSITDEIKQYDGQLRQLPIDKGLGSVNIKS